MRRPERAPAGPGQESVWDYPRPPRVEPSSRLVEVDLAGRTVASTRRALRVLETSHPPTWYVPVADVTPGALRPSPEHSVCEWKGEASYFDVVVGDRVAARAAWGYSSGPLAGHVAFYAGAVDACRVDGAPVRPQEGGFYGGWITPDLAGPFKGGPGTAGW